MAMADKKNRNIRPETLQSISPRSANKIRHDLNSSVRFLEQSGLVYIIKCMCLYSSVLPYFSHLSVKFVQFFRKQICDNQMQDDLENRLIINWWPKHVFSRLHCISTKGDGNCLPHSVSFYLWGLDDSLLYLRQLMHTFILRNDETEDKMLKKRWRNEKTRQLCFIPGGEEMLDSKDWEEEWQMVIVAAKGKMMSKDSPFPYVFLEEVHIFIIANLLRRPIIVLAENVLRNLEGETMDINHFNGIYLPLLWDAKDCLKDPILLGFDHNHFVPLICEDSLHKSHQDRTLLKNVIPLVDSLLEPMPLRFITKEEDNKYKELVEKYFNIENITLEKLGKDIQVAAAKCEHTPHQGEFNLMKPFYQHYELKYNQISNIFPIRKSLSTYSTPNTSNQVDTELDEFVFAEIQQEYITVCRTPGCGRDASPNHPSLCMQCYNQNQASNATKRIPKLRLRIPTRKKSPSRRKTYPANQIEYEEFEHIEAEKMTNCQFPSCSNQASTHFFPYCIKHQYYDKTPVDSVRFASLNLLQEREYSPDEENRSHSLESSPRLCRVKQCDMYGTVANLGMCSKHFDQHVERQRDVDRNKDTLFYCESKRIDMARDFRAEQQSDTLQFLQDFPQVTVSEPRHASEHMKCMTSQCMHTASKSTFGFCPSCFKKEVLKGNLPDPRRIPSAPIQEPLQLSLNSPKSNEYSSSEASDFICLSDNCSGVASERTNGFCWYCYYDQERSQQVPAHRTLTEAEPKASVERRKCVFHNCSRSGEERYCGLCKICYDVLENEHGNPATTTPVDLDTSLTSSVVSIIRCLKCGAFGGEPFLDNFCRTCYLQKRDEYLSAVKASTKSKENLENTKDVGTMFKTTAAEIETSSRTSKSRCKTLTCTNYGNPNKRGYCNHCSVPLGM